MLLRSLSFLAVLAICVQNLELLDRVVLWPNGTRFL
jgi:hypothetical protein